MAGTMTVPLQPSPHVSVSRERQISSSLSSCSLRGEQLASYGTAHRNDLPRRCSRHTDSDERVFLRTTAFSNDSGAKVYGQRRFLFRNLASCGDGSHRYSGYKHAVGTSGWILGDRHCSTGTDLSPSFSSSVRGGRFRIPRARSVEGTEKSSGFALSVDHQNVESSLEDNSNGAGTAESRQPEGTEEATSSTRDNDGQKIESSVEDNQNGAGKAEADGRSGNDAQAIHLESEENCFERLLDGSQDGSVGDADTDESDEQSRDGESKGKGFRDEGSIDEQSESTKEEEVEKELQDYGDEDDWDTEVPYVSRIPVPRQKFISVPKVDLVNALLLFFFPSSKDPSKFLSICSYLEIILHTEHKFHLEELRSDYSVIQTIQDGKLVDSSKRFRVQGATNASKLGSPVLEREEKHRAVGDPADWPADSQDSDGGFGKIPAVQTVVAIRSKVADAFQRSQKKIDPEGEVAEDPFEGPSNYAEASAAAEERFQKNTLALLARAQFEGISVRDLELTSALNPDYLLTLPVDVDWKRTSSANVKIFRRGYTKEETKGFLLGAKLDYVQAATVRRLLKGLTGPLLQFGEWLIMKWKSLWENDNGRKVAKSVSGWLQEPLQLQKEEPLKDSEQPNDEEAEKLERDLELDMPIWLAARQAVPRYEAFLSSAGSRGMVIRRILMRMGLLQPESPTMTLPTFGDNRRLEPHLRPNHLARVSMKDIWRPTSKAVVGQNVLKKISSAFSVFFSQAVLQEPAYKELVLLYNGMDEEDAEMEGLQLQTYRNIPLPDLKIVFPSKKLIYRALDTLRLDITSVAGLLAFVVDYRFDNLLSSPSAFALDVIAASALVVFVSRVVFGYKNVWDRYQLLVNKTLYEKTGARGFGVIQFLLDESEEQQFKEAILVFLLLMNEGKNQGMTKAQLANACEKFLYYRCKEQVEMPVDTAVDTLRRLGLIIDTKETGSDSEDQANVSYKTVSYDQSLRALEAHWISQPQTMSLWN